MRRGDNSQTDRVLVIGSAAVLSAAAILLFSRLVRTTASDSRAFANKAFTGGLFEIESSQLALDRSKNEDVCQLAHTMIDDHMRINRGLHTVLSKSDIVAANIKKELDSDHQKMLDRLVEEPDDTFDHAYVEAQKQAHHEAIKLFGGYTRKFGGDSALKDFAERILPTLKHHRDMVQDIDLGKLQH